MTGKRKKVDKSEEGTMLQEEPPTKKLKDDFTDITFKVLLKDTNTTFIALEKFIEHAKEYEDGRDCDIVAKFCQTSGECSEIFKLLEGGKRKPAELQLIFTALEHILLRTADDLTKYQLVAQNIIRRLLAGHMASVYYVLANQNKSSHIKASLKLLVAMVMQGEAAARDMVMQFNFGHPNIAPLLNRRDAKDPQDVRTCLLHFMMSFLITGDNGVIKQLIATKGFLNGIFAGLVNDKLATVQLVLSTLLEKVVQNPAVNKTFKIRLFNDRTLKELSHLYRWQGPVPYSRDAKQGKQSQQQQQQQDLNTEQDVLTLTEDQLLLRDTVQQFLLEICCSFKHGINFYDKTFSTSNKNQNHILTSFLKSLARPHLQPVSADLVLQSLQACPDLLRWYLPCLQDSLTPRSSAVWLRCMTFLEKVYRSQPTVCLPLMLTEMVETPKLVAMMLATLVPPREVWNQVLTAVKHEQLLVRHWGLRFLGLTLQRISAALGYCAASTRNHLQSIPSALQMALMRVLPSLPVLFTCWAKAVKRKDGQNRDEDDNEEEEEEEKEEEEEGEQKEEKKEKEAKRCDVDKPESLPAVPVPEHLQVILQVLCHYQAASPRSFRDHPVDFSSLLEGVRGACHQMEQPRQMAVLQVHLLKLLSELDTRQMPWSKASVGGRSTLYLLLEMVVSTGGDVRLGDCTRRLVNKLLCGTGLFEGTEEELLIWLAHLASTPAGETGELLELLERCLLALMRRPQQYLETVSQCVAEAGGMMEQSSDDHREVSDASSAVTSQAVIDAILSMDDAVLMAPADSQGDASAWTARSAFSPLIVIALEECSNLTQLQPGVENFLRKVIVEIVRVQMDPGPIAQLIHQMAAPAHIAVLLPSVAPWLKSKKSHRRKSSNALTPSRHARDELIEGSLADMLQQCFEEGSTLLVDAAVQSRLQEAAGQVAVKDLVPVAKQILLYVYTNVAQFHQDKASCGQRIELYFDLLCRVISIQSGGQSSETSSIESSATSKAEPEGDQDLDVTVDLPALKLAEPSSTQALEEFLCYFLSHPIVSKFFLWSPDGLNKEKVKVVKQRQELSGILSLHVAKILAVVLRERAGSSGGGGVSGQGSLLKRLVERVEQQLERVVSTKDPLTLEMLRVLVPLMSDRVLVKLCSLLLELPPRDMILGGHGKAAPPLTECGTLLESAMARLTEPSCLASHAIPRGLVQRLARLDIAVPVESYSESLHKILTSAPTYTVALDRETFVDLLDSARPDLLRSAAAMTGSSPRCRRWFHTWFCSNKSLTQVKQACSWKYSYVVLQHLSLMKYGDEKDHDRALKMAHKLYWADLVKRLVSSDQPKHLRDTLMHYIITHSPSTLCVETLWQELEARFSSADSTVTCSQVEVLQQATRRLEQGDTGNHGDALTRRTKFARCCLVALSSALRKKPACSAEAMDKLLDVLLDMLKDDAVVVELAVNDIWDSFVKYGLRYNFTDAKFLQLLNLLIPRAYGKATTASRTEASTADTGGREAVDDQKESAGDGDAGAAAAAASSRRVEDDSEAEGSLLVSCLPVTAVHEMLVSHSEFLPIMLTEGGGGGGAKDALLEVLLSLVERQAQCCQVAHVAVLLGAYGATMAHTDQKLQRLLHLYEEAGHCDFTQYRPYMWGPKAVEHHSVKKSLGKSLWKAPSMEQVVQLLDKERLFQSALTFPLLRKLQGAGSDQPLHHSPLMDQCYDPAFLLPLFSHLLSPECLVDCRQFVDHGCLSYVTCGLSSHDAHVRGAAYHTLARFCSHLEGATRFAEKYQVQGVLECLQNSVEESNAKVPCIVTVFVAKALLLMLKPEEHMYQMVNSFMLLKPAMDLGNVPEFYLLFNSSALEYKSERSWMLMLLQDGLRETHDYHIFEKRFIFKLLLNFYDSAVSDIHTQNQVLGILLKACTLKSVTYDLCKNHSLLTWLHRVVKTSCHDALRNKRLVSIVRQLWQTMLGERDAKPDTETAHPYLPVLFTNEMLLVLLTMLHNASKFLDVETLQMFLECLDSVLAHAQKTEMLLQPQLQGGRAISVALTGGAVLQLLQHWGHVTCDDQLLEELRELHGDVQLGGVEKTDFKSTVSERTRAKQLAAGEGRDEEAEDAAATEAGGGRPDADADATLVLLLHVVSHWQPQTPRHGDQPDEMLKSGGPAPNQQASAMTFVLTTRWAIRKLLNVSSTDLDTWQRLTGWIDSWLRSVDDFKSIFARMDIGIIQDTQQLLLRIYDLVLGVMHSQPCAVVRSGSADTRADTADLIVAVVNNLNRVFAVILDLDQDHHEEASDVAKQECFVPRTKKLKQQQKRVSATESTFNRSQQIWDEWLNAKDLSSNIS